MKEEDIMRLNNKKQSKTIQPKHFKVTIITFLFLTVASFASAQWRQQLKPFILEGTTQGTYYRVTYYATDSVVKKADVEKLLKEFLMMASLWEPNSIISKINDNEDVELNEDFIKIYNTAHKISQESNGAFDITIGDLVNLWGFGNKEGSQPSKQAIDSLKKFVGYQNVEIKNNKICKKYPQTTLNLNGIAKGYSVDLLSKYLIDKGLSVFLVDIGGEIRGAGLKPDGKAWAVAIEEPREDDSDVRDIHKVIELKNKSIATSGTYRRYYMKNGIRYSHTIDPRTGYPVNHTLLSVTVIADKCVEADALATAFMVNGKDWSLNFLKMHPEYDAYFIYSEKDGLYKTAYSKGFAKYLRR